MFQGLPPSQGPNQPSPQKSDGSQTPQPQGTWARRWATAVNAVKRTLGMATSSDLSTTKNGIKIDKRTIRHITQPVSDEEASKLKLESSGHKWKIRWNRIKAVVTGRKSTQKPNTTVKSFRTLGEGAFGKVDSVIQGYAGKLDVRKTIKVAPDAGMEVRIKQQAAMGRENNLQKSLNHPNIVGASTIQEDLPENSMFRNSMLMENAGVPLSQVIHGKNEVKDDSSGNKQVKWQVHGINNQAVDIYDYQPEPSEGSKTPPRPVEYIHSYGGRLPTPVIQKTFSQVLQGLSYLEQKKVIHGDIKPDNILINPGRLGPDKDSAGKDSADKDEAVVKIADFGLAEYLPDNKSTKFQGTPTYLAPEIIDSGFNGGKTTYGREIDTFATACVFFELITGRQLQPAWHKDISLEEFCHYYQGHVRTSEFLANMETQVRGALHGEPPEYIDLAVDLLQRMLEVDPARRITPTAALAHPFMRYRQRPA